MKFLALLLTLLKEEMMLVHPVTVPGSGTRSWTVLGDDDVPVVPVDRFLAYLTDIGRSPNTVKAYASISRTTGPSSASVPSTGARPGWKTSASSWPGCGFPGGPGRRGRRCCRR